MASRTKSCLRIGNGGQNMKALMLAAAVFGMSVAAYPAAAQTSGWNGTWTGPYVGGRLGIGALREEDDQTVEFDTDLNGSFGDTVTTITGADAFSRGFCAGAVRRVEATRCNDSNDTEFALHVGYDYQLAGSFVVGAVAEYGKTNLEDSVTAFSSTPAFYTFTRELDDTAALRLRAGYAFGGTLIYGTGGVAYGKIDNRFTTSNGVNTFTESGGDEDVYGYRVGGGIEQRVSGFSIGAQYLYTSLKADTDFTVRAGGANVPVSNPFILENPNGTDMRPSSGRFNSHNVSVVASFHF